MPNITRRQWLQRVAAGSAAILSTGLIPGCNRPVDFQEVGFAVFGQIWRLRFANTDPKLINQAANLAENWVEPLYQQIHPYQESKLTEVNRALQEQGIARISSDISALYEHARFLFEATNGLFDASIGGLIALWGFHADGEPDRSKPPTEREIRNWLDKAVQFDAIQRHNQTLYTTNPYVQLDFNAIAEGYAVSQLIKQFRTMGISNCLIDPGGDITAMGLAGNRPWRIGIEHPRTRALVGTIALEDGESIATSGDYQRQFEYQGQRYAHIINPKTARPAQTLASVTATGASPVYCDGATTALMLTDPAKDHKLIAEIMQRCQVKRVLMIDREGHSWANRAMHDTLEPIDASAFWQEPITLLPE